MTLVAEKPKIKKIQVLKVLPYINPDSDPESMGSQLASYKLVLQEGTSYKEQLTCLEKNGIKRYLTGLNEFAPEIQNVQDKSDREAAIRDIRKKVSFLEQALGSNVVNIDLSAKEFWEQVKIVHPTNDKFWATIFMEAGNEPVFLNPEEPHDLVKICGIKAGGFSVIAKSYEDARLSANPPKFYLDEANETASNKVEDKKIKNAALTYLTELSNKNKNKLFYIIKNVDVTNSYQYKKGTPADVIYDYLDDYISGKGYEKSSRKASSTFNEICALPEEDLRIKAVIADASFYKIISGKGDGLLYHIATDTMIGKNASEVVTFFKNPLYTKTWESILAEVEKSWND